MSSLGYFLVLILTIVEIRGQDSGPYSFSYNTQGEGPANMFREERRQADGTIVGKYGYTDPNGQLRVVEYRALGPDNFQARGDIGPDSEALRYHQEQLAAHERATANFMREWTRLAARSGPVGPSAAVPRTQSWPSAPGPRRVQNKPPVAPRQRTQPPQATLTWEDQQGGRASVWTQNGPQDSFSESARLPPAPSAPDTWQPRRESGTGNGGWSQQWSASPSQEFNRRSGPSGRNTAASARPQFEGGWPSSSDQMSPLKASDNQYSYGFRIQHAP